jgi:hypothetical protein
MQLGRTYLVTPIDDAWEVRIDDIPVGQFESEEAAVAWCREDSRRFDLELAGNSGESQSDYPFDNGEPDFGAGTNLFGSCSCDD